MTRAASIPHPGSILMSGGLHRLIVNNAAGFEFLTRVGEEKKEEGIIRIREGNFQGWLGG